MIYQFEGDFYFYFCVLDGVRGWGLFLRLTMAKSSFKQEHPMGECRRALSFCVELICCVRCGMCFWCVRLFLLCLSEGLGW